MQKLSTGENPPATNEDALSPDPWRLPCKNGMINLRTGELEPFPAHPCPRLIPHEYHGMETPCPIWEQALLEIFSGLELQVKCFQRMCGQALVGRVERPMMVVMTGRGCNGKSLVVQTLSKVLGPFAGTLPFEILQDQAQVMNPEEPFPDITALRGLRMAFLSESDNTGEISKSGFKRLTGAAPITGQDPSGHVVRFNPSHTLFLVSNYYPFALAAEGSCWSRIVHMPFDMSFVDREPDGPEEHRADPDLAGKLERELPGILAWMVRGYRLELVNRTLIRALHGRETDEDCDT